MTQNSNPLRKHFRQPAVYIRLPSKGKHYTPDSLEMPANGELPVFPMTAMDEITSRTPDALFNGSAVVEIIRSCIPNIRDPWAIPATDINALLVAMRLASYGHMMEISSTCPKCGHQHEFEMDLRIILDTLKSADYDQPMTLGDLTLYFAPLTYKSINDIGQRQFEDQKVTATMGDADISEEEKIAKLGEAYRRITQLTLYSLCLSVAAIKTADAMVTDQAHIMEYLQNCERSQFDLIRDHVIQLRSASELKPLDITCSNCTNQYQQQVTLDISNFFVTN